MSRGIERAHHPFLFTDGQNKGVGAEDQHELRHDAFVVVGAVSDRADLDYDERSVPRNLFSVTLGDCPYPLDRPSIRPRAHTSSLPWIALDLRHQPVL